MFSAEKYTRDSKNKSIGTVIFYKMKCFAVNHQSYYKLGGVVPSQIYKSRDNISTFFSHYN